MMSEHVAERCPRCGSPLEGRNPYLPSYGRYECGSYDREDTATIECYRRQLAQAHERMFALQLQIGKGDDEWMRYHALYVKARREIFDLQRDNERLRAAWDEMRDSVLNERGPLAEMGLTPDQINAVLSVIDDAWPDNLSPSSENPLATYTDGQLYEELVRRGWVATTWAREGGAEGDEC